MSSQLTFSINEPAKEFIKLNSDTVKTVNRPPGVNFYVARWDAKNLGIANFTHPNNSFVITNVLSVTAADDMHSPEEGLVHFSINAGISADEFITHDEARVGFIKVLQMIRRSGWEVFISEGDPRLRGKDMLNFALIQSPSSSLDADYHPTFDEWMKIPSNTRWSFYGEDVYLSIEFMREPTMLDPEKPGSYLITYTFESENEHYRNYVEPEQRVHWRESLLRQFSTLPILREKTEAELGSRGIKIDTQYRGPKAPEL